MKKPDSPEYLAKRRFFNKFLTVYGKKVILDILTDSPDVEIAKILVAEQTKGINDIMQLAKKRRISVEFTSPERVSRISKNKSQDQGIVADISAPNYLSLEDFLHQSPKQFRLLALDGITTPANLGMIIRTVAASSLDGLVIPTKGCPSVANPLVIKASAGTIFKAKIIVCEDLATSLPQLKQTAARVCALAADSKQSLFEYATNGSVVYVLGNESVGISPETAALTDDFLYIPMNNNVESLNVHAAATLVAYKDQMAGR